MQWTLYSLAKEPEFQRGVQAEIDDVMKGRTCGDIEWYVFVMFYYHNCVARERFRHCYDNSGY
jgi:hypothetical protein